MEIEILGVLSLALGIGLLIGLQRERSGSRVAGIRTFPLIALFGAMCGLLAAEWGVLVIAAGLIAVTALLVLANVGKAREGAETSGQTTEVAALLTFALGAFLPAGHYAVVLVVAGLAAVLLHFKKPLHEFAGDLNEADVRAFMRFVIISLVILPVLPNETYGPYAVLNPREIWLMVVLIVGIGLVGYVSYKLFRGRAGVAIAGVLGGLISSTATTVAYARRARGTASAQAVAAVIIGIAWTVSVARMIVEVIIVAPALAAALVPPLAVLLAVMAAACALMWSFRKSQPGEMPTQGNPAELRSALVFAALYAALILLTAAVKDWFGDDALYAVALVSGVVDVDAITLSTAQLAAQERVAPAQAWKVMLIAALSNVVFKGVAVIALGSMGLFVRVLPLFAAALGTGAALFIMWPGTNP